MNDQTTISNQAAQHNKPFTVSSILVEAWRLVNGLKGSIWTILAVVLIIGVIIGAAAGFVDHATLSDSSSRKANLFNFLVELITYLILAPFIAGLMMVPILHARQEVIKLRSGFKYFNRWIPTAMVLILIRILTIAVTFLTVFVAILLKKPDVVGIQLWPTVLMALGFLASVFINLFCQFGVPFVVDKGCSTLDAIKASVKTVAKHWLRLFALLLCILLVILITILPIIFMSIKFYHHAGMIILGGVVSIIIAVWLIPYALQIPGLAYHKLID